MTNKEKFMNLVSQEKTNSVDKLVERIKNRAFLKESQYIARKIIFRMDELNLTQNDFAKILGVSPQQVNKYVSGKENFTINTLIKLQTELNISLLASYLEKQYEDNVYSISTQLNYISEEFIEKKYNKIGNKIVFEKKFIDFDTYNIAI